MKKSILAVSVALMLTIFALPSFSEINVTDQQKNDIQKEKSVKTEVAPAAEQTEKTVAEAETEKAELKEQSKQVAEKAEDVKPAETTEKVEAKVEKSEQKEGIRLLNYSKDKSKTEIELKVGRTFNAKPEVDRQEIKVDDVYTVGIEVMAYSNSFIGFGAGIYNIFDSTLKDKDGNTIYAPGDKKYKIAFTNPYLTLKSKILQFDSDVIRNIYIYGQIGYGFMRIENAFETEDGMYWGIGGGVEIWHFLLDVNYATNFGKIKMAPGEKKLDVRQSTLIVSVGYRFRL